MNISFLKPGEIIKAREANLPVFLPLGPLEWHGPHLPFGVDPLRAELASAKLAEEYGGIVFPVLFLGTERERTPEMLKNIGFKGDEYIEGMDFPENRLPSLYLKEEVFALVLRNYLELIIDRWKFKRIVIVNGHGGENHLKVIERLKKEFTACRNVKILHLMPLLDFPLHRWSHATKEETETFLAYYPEMVNLKKLPRKDKPLKNVKWGIVDDMTFRGKPTKDFTVRNEEDPRDADIEKGRQVFKKTVKQLRKILEEEFR
jgi:creatinine amidohydrolase